MAPALYMPGIPALKRGLPACPISVVHGWRDEIIPCEQSMRFARENRLALHLVEADHRLHAAIPLPAVPVPVLPGRNAPRAVRPVSRAMENTMDRFTGRFLLPWLRFTLRPRDVAEKIGEAHGARLLRDQPCPQARCAGPAARLRARRPAASTQAAAARVA